MATYLELEALRNDETLIPKVSMAAVIKAQSLIDAASPTAGQVEWANETLRNPRDRARVLVRYVIAANKGLDVAAIKAASDSAIQTNVDAAVDKLITS